jgi:hypothetical protein
MNRRVVAFLPAPLAVPLVMSAVTLQNPSRGALPVLVWPANRDSSLVRRSASRGRSGITHKVPQS